MGWYLLYLFLSGRVSLSLSWAAAEGECPEPGSISVGDKVRALRSRGGGMGLILLARDVSPFFWESGDEDSVERVGGLMELGREEEVDTEAPSSFFSFLTERSRGSWTGTGLPLSSMSDSLPTSISSSSEEGSLLILSRSVETLSEVWFPDAAGREAGAWKESVKAALNISFYKGCSDIIFWKQKDFLNNLVWSIQ